MLSKRYATKPFDDLECDAMPGCRSGSTFAGIALIDPGKFDAVIGDGLHGPRKPLHLTAILCAGRRDVERQQMAQRIDGHVDLRALLALAPS